jgi:hypothetical protein
VDLAQSAHHREQQAAGPLAVRLELLGQRERRAQVPRHERVGEVVGLGRGVARGQGLDVGGRDVRARVDGQRQLLQLAREALLAGAHQRDQLLGRLLIYLDAQLTAALEHPLRQFPGLRRGVLAHLAARPWRAA